MTFPCDVKGDSINWRPFFFSVGNHQRPSGALSSFVNEQVWLKYKFLTGGAHNVDTRQMLDASGSWQVDQPL